MEKGCLMPLPLGRQLDRQHSHGGRRVQQGPRHRHQGAEADDGRRERERTVQTAGVPTEHQLSVEANNLAAELDVGIGNIRKFAKEKYSGRSSAGKKLER